MLEHFEKNLDGSKAITKSDRSKSEDNFYLFEIKD